MKLLQALRRAIDRWRGFPPAADAEAETSSLTEEERERIRVVVQRSMRRSFLSRVSRLN